MLSKLLRLAAVVIATIASVYTFDAHAGIERVTVIEEGTTTSGAQYVKVY